MNNTIMIKKGILVAISLLLLQPFTAYAAEILNEEIIVDTVSTIDPRIAIITDKFNSFGIKTYQGSKDKRDFNKATCIAKHLLDLKSDREALNNFNYEIFLKLNKESPLPKNSIEGLNVNITCQMGYFVSDGKVIKIFEVTTGSKDSTPRGIYKAQRKTPTWRKSTIYDVLLYKPININGAIAIHGVPSPSMIKYSPASRGCIRVPNHVMDWLYEKIPLGDKVNVFGKW